MTALGRLGFVTVVVFFILKSPWTVSERAVWFYGYLSLFQTEAIFSDEVYILIP